MELRNFFRNSLGLAIFGVAKGDYDSAQLCFTTAGMPDPVWLDLDVLDGPTYWIHTNDRDHNAGTQDYSHSVKDAERLKIVAPTLAFLEQKFEQATQSGSVIKVKAILRGKDREPMEIEADSTSWKWPSYYIE